jgi:hypothetical protein
MLGMCMTFSKFSFGLQLNVFAALEPWGFSLLRLLSRGNRTDDPSAHVACFTAHVVATMGLAVCGNSDSHFS